MKGSRWDRTHPAPPEPKGLWWTVGRWVFWIVLVYGLLALLLWKIS